jgi:hypothetical protein
MIRKSLLDLSHIWHWENVGTLLHMFSIKCILITRREHEKKVCAASGRNPPVRFHTCEPLHHRVLIGVEDKKGECICPLSWSVHHNPTLLVMVDRVKGGWRAAAHPLPSPGWADFTLMMECTPESGRGHCHCHSVYSVPLHLCTLCVSQRTHFIYQMYCLYNTYCRCICSMLIFSQHQDVMLKVWKEDLNK